MRRTIAFSFLLLFLTVAAAAQQASVGLCALDRTSDFKLAKSGDRVALHLARDLVVNGKTLHTGRVTVITAGRFVSQCDSAAFFFCEL